LRNFCYSFLLLLFLLSVMFVLPGHVDALYDGSFIPGEILVKFYSFPEISKEGLSVRTGISEIDSINEKYSVTSMEPVYSLNSEKLYSSSPVSTVYKIRFPEKFNVLEVADAYSLSGELEFVQPNYLLYADRVPNDPEYTEQQAYMEVMNAPAGWDIETGRQSVVIAVVDSGVDWNHPDLASNIWINPGEIPDDGIDNEGNGFVDDVRGYDFVSIPSASVVTGEDPEPIDNNPDDFSGHGTFVSSQIAAVGNNSLGIAGMTWSCRIMPSRAGYQAPGQTNAIFSSADVAAAITYAADNGAHIINMSFGVQADPASFPVITQAVTYALDKGVFVVAAAGNRNLSNSDFPANIEGVLSVGSLNNDGTKSSFSNYGTNVDVYTVGSNIYGSYPEGVHSQTGATPARTGNARSNGTSFSSPLTAGLAALILSTDPAMNRQKVTEQILNFSDITSSGYNQINVYRSLTEGDLKEREIIYNLPPGWSLISFPLTGVTSVSGFDGSFYYDEGREGEAPQEIPQTSPALLEPGKAYWTYNPDSAVREGRARGSVIMTATFTRTLSPAGMIPLGNPFTLSDIPWGSDSVTTGDGTALSAPEMAGILESSLYYYDTATASFLPLDYDNGNFERQRGYYLVNRAGTELLFSR